MTWVAIAIGGSALIGAGASYAGSKKQSKASEKAGALNMDMFNTLNRQQQPYIQSGYGAMGRLNTLLGLNPRPMMRPPANPGYMPTPGGGVHPIMQMGYAPQGGANPRLAQLLALRAANGDSEAGRVLGSMGG